MALTLPRCPNCDSLVIVTRLDMDPTPGAPLLTREPVKACKTCDHEWSIESGEVITQGIDTSVCYECKEPAIYMGLCLEHAGEEYGPQYPSIGELV